MSTKGLPVTSPQADRRAGMSQLTEARTLTSQRECRIVDDVEEKHVSRQDFRGLFVDEKLKGCHRMYEERAGCVHRLGH